MSTEATIEQPIAALPEFAGILRDAETFAGSGDTQAVADRFNGWFDRLMIQSGMPVTGAVLLLLSMLGGLTIGGALFVIEENLFVAVPATCVGFCLPTAIVAGIRSRRQTLMMNQLPGMIDELSRAARTGRSLEQCLEIVAADTPKPLGGELQYCTRRLKMGLDISGALADLPERTGLVTLHILATALSVHQQTGGDLVSVLERLSRTVRDRILFLGRLKAATIAARATAVLMISVPPAVMVFFSIRDPDYFSELLGSTWGRRVTVTALFLQVVGSVWVLRILQKSRRG